MGVFTNDLNNYKYIDDSETVTTTTTAWDSITYREAPTITWRTRPHQRIKVKYLPGAQKLAMTEVGDWCDLYVYDDIELKKGDFALISLGFAAQLPNGYEANIVPRSSTFKKYGLLQTNHYAVIDESYCGNDDIWRYPVLATRDISIPKGTRLCQFRINEKQPDLIFEEVDDLENESRGGFGSTGD